MLKKQLYRVYILALFIPVLVIGSFLLYNNYSMIYGHHVEMLKSDNLRIKSIMYEMTTAITNIGESIAEDKSVHELIRTSYVDSEAANRALREMTIIDEYYVRHTEVSTITLYTNNPTLTSYGHISKVEEENMSWYLDKISRPGYYWSAFEGENNLGVEYTELQLMRAINIPQSEIDGLLIITISNNYIKNRIDNNQLDVDITVNKDPIFYSTWGNGSQNIEFMNYSDEEYFKYSGENGYLGRSGLFETSTIQPIKSDDSIYVFSSDPEALIKIQRIQLWTIMIVCLAILIPLWIIFKFTGQFTNRVYTLRHEMHRVTSGDYNIIETFKGNDELVDLFSDLQIMISSIKERDLAIFDADIKEQQLINSQQKMELEILSSKINPHFLYNTLETIRMKAISSDDIEVASGIKLLGKYMRYNLESNGELVALQSEIDFISIYLNIQQLRFGNKISSVIKVDESIDMYKVDILPLLIQPIVENAFIHGHQETLEDGIIDITITDRGDHIYINISDNGTGIKESKLEEIQELLVQTEYETKSSFGLYNIHQRLKLYYGDEYGLQIKSKVGQTTDIGFLIPKV